MNRRYFQTSFSERCDYRTIVSFLNPGVSARASYEKHHGDFDRLFGINDTPNRGITKRSRFSDRQPSGTIANRCPHSTPILKAPRSCWTKSAGRFCTNCRRSARISLAELGRRVGLSTAAVVERVRRMEEEGIILGYHAEIDHGKLGISITAFIRITVQGEALKRAISQQRKGSMRSWGPSRHRNRFVRHEGGCLFY